MHHDFIDRYGRIDSPIHRLPASLKVVSALLLVLGVVVAPLRLVYPFLAAGVGLVLVIALSRIPPVFFLKRLLVFEPFVVVIAAASLIQPEGGLRFASVIIKSTLSLTTVLLLSNTTPFSELLDVFRRLHAPSFVVTVLALMYRYIFVLIDETQRMRRARLSRTFAPGRPRAWHSASQMIGQLFLRSTERAERIFAAMSARGWQ